MVDMRLKPSDFLDPLSFDKYEELLCMKPPPLIPNPNKIEITPKYLLNGKGVGVEEFRKPFTFNPPGWETWAETNYYVYDDITRIEIKAQHPELGIGPLRVVYELVNDPYERDSLRIEAVNKLWQLMIAEEATSRGLV